VLRAWYEIARRAAERWLEDRAPSMGAAVAYYAVFSLAPILLLITAIAGLIFGQEAAEGALFGELASLVGPESAAAMQAMLRSASGEKSGLIAGAVAVATLTIGATAVLGELQAALNIIWKCETPSGAGLWYLVKSRLLGLSLILSVGFLLLVSLAISAGLTAFGKYLASVMPGLPILLEILHSIFAFLVTSVLFAMIFKILPDADIEWREVWLGAATASLLFTVGKFLIGLYIGTSAIASTYGAAGTLAVILVWVYYSAQILLFGAEIAKAYSEHRRKRPSPSPASGSGFSRAA
jgi:membrane protein